MKERFSFELKILGLMLVLLVLVGITGTFTYQRFSSIIRNFSQEARPDLRLLTMKSLVNDINTAENSVKTFSLTKDTVYLDQFYLSASSADQKMEVLMGMENEAEAIQFPLDTLDSLINGKLAILRNILMMQDEFRVQAALDKVVQQIQRAAQEAADETDAHEPESTTLSTVENSNTSDFAEIEVDGKTKKRRGFLSRLFGKKEEDSGPELMPDVSEKEVATSVPDKVQKSRKKEKVSLSEVTREVQGVKKEERNIERAIRARELELIMADRQISEKIRSLLSLFESEETDFLAEQAEEAELAVKRTNSQIAIFCIVTALLLIFMSYIIISYIRNDRKYRKVLRQARRDAEDLAQAKERFMANISHEIRTPMNAIAGFTEQLAASKLDQVQRDQLKMVQRSIDHLNYLINDVLDFTKLQSGKLKLEAIGFKPAEVVSDVVMAIQHLTQDKDVRLKSEISKDVPEIIVGDPFRLRQILLNLMGNAVKFTEKGTVQVSLKSLLRNSETVRLRLEIRDTGVGMSSEQLKKVFREFEQAELSTARIYGGTGLGLSITKMLVERHEGSIEIKSERHKGTAITIEIPYLIGTVTDLPEVASGPTETDGSMEGLRILIADDEPYNRKLLDTILRKHHAVITEVSDGAKAVEELLKNRYDLLLMDVRMPEMNGIEATLAIRKLKQTEKRIIPIIALTAAVGEEDKIKYREAGMNAFLSKPYTERQLIGVISETIGLPRFKKDSPKKSGVDIEQSMNFEDLRDLSGNDEQFYIDMLEMFCSSTKSGLADMKTAFHEEDYLLMAELAHRLASPANHLGASRLYTLLKLIEDKGRNNEDLDHLEEYLEDAQKSASRAFAQVSKELENFRAGKNKK